MDGHEFGGVIGRYWYESTPWWPPEPRPPLEAPNVLIILLDDVGFAQLGCYGSDIETPTFDGLAAAGLRYTNFHTTSLCSPTRACVLTGRNHHACGVGRIVDLPLGFPGYDGRIPKSAGLLPEMLVPHGYAAYAVGKWHLTPEDECHQGASRARWPLSRGFERFYGFHGGETHQFAPSLVYDNHQIPPPRTIADGYHLTEDLADKAIEFLADLRSIDDAKPFFMYFCPGACHAPHQAPTEWLARYRGTFDRGWDVVREETFARQMTMGLLPSSTVLSPRPEWVPAWDELTPDQRRVSARYMEAFAAMLSHTDHHVGRLLSFLDETGDRDNTIVFLMSDNGASSEGGRNGSVNFAHLYNGGGMRLADVAARIDDIGGPRFHNNYPWGWTVAGNTPFRRWKREVHEGGVADPLIVHWPAGIGPEARGGNRHQYVHAIDVVPTILAISGLPAPAELNGVEQKPIHGVSFAPTFAPEAVDPSEATGVPSAHHTQYSEMFGCRALYHKGWKAVVYHQIQRPDENFHEDVWELYHVETDPSECHDLAAERPDLLREMIDRWWVEAASNNVLPLDNRPISASVRVRPPLLESRNRYVYWPGTATVPENVAADVKNRSHTITAHIEITGAPTEASAEGHANTFEGVLCAQGSLLGGWTLFVLDGHLTYVHNLTGDEQHRISGPLPRLVPGPHTLAFAFGRTGEHQGLGTLFVDGTPIATGSIPRFTPVAFSVTGIGLSCGEDAVLAVVDNYSVPFPFDGPHARLARVVIEVDGDRHLDAEAEAEIAIMVQ